MIPEKYIEDITTDFYELAIKDILIGYHFRHIDDFDTHIPRIAQFWNLQINGKISNRSLLPFRLLEVHQPLKLNRGEIFRWKKLFESVLDKYCRENKINTAQKGLWISKINLFANRLELFLFGANSI